MTHQPPPNGFRTFVIVWITQSISVIGSALTFFAVNLWLLNVAFPRPDQKSALAAALSAISLAFALPVVFGGPIAGAWADRHDRKRTMLVVDVVSGLLNLILAGLLVTNQLHLWMLIILLAIAAMVGAFHSAAFDTSYAMLVPDHLLPRANGMMQTLFSLSNVLAPTLGAGIVAWAASHPRPGVANPSAFGVALAVGIDAVTFLISALVLVFVSIPSPERADLQGDQPKPSLWADVRQGALYIWHRRPLLWLLGTFTVANLVGGPLAILESLLIKFTLAPDWLSRGFGLESALALLATSGSIGGVLGGILISTWGGLKQRRVYGVVVPLLVQGLVMVVLGFSRLLYLSAFLIGAQAALIPILNAHSQAIWQTQTPKELQGRVFSVRRLIAQCSWPLSTALAGWLGGRFDPGAIVSVLGTILAVFCAGQLLNRYLLRVEDKAWLDQLALKAAGEQV